jgi:hypothetical protein
MNFLMLIHAQFVLNQFCSFWEKNCLTCSPTCKTMHYGSGFLDFYIMNKIAFDWFSGFREELKV